MNVPLFRPNIVVSGNWLQRCTPIGSVMCRKFVDFEFMLVMRRMCVTPIRLTHIRQFVGFMQVVFDVGA